MKEVVFTVDFADKKKGDTFKADSMLASHLVNIDKVATYKKVEKEVKPKDSK